MKNSVFIFLLTLIFTHVVLVFDQSHKLNDIFLFIFFSLAILILSIIQIGNLKKKYSNIYFVNPPVLCTLITFLLPFGLTNFFLESNSLNSIVNLSSTYKILFIVINSLNIMWVGYWFADGMKYKIYNTSNKILKAKDYLIIKCDDIKFYYLIIFVLCSLASFLIMNYLNIYGYSANPQSLILHRTYAYTLHLILNMHYLALIIMTFLIFKSNQTIIFKSLYLLLIVIMVIFGLLSGFKSPIIYPFIIIFIIYYICKNKFSLSLFFLLIFSTYCSYNTIDFFRVNISAEKNINKINKDSIAVNIVKKNYDTVLNYFGENIFVTSIKISEFIKVFYQLNSRINSLEDASLGLNIIHSNPKILEKENTPDFLTSIVISPISAIIPRFVWKSKPVNTEGEWFSKIVYAKNAGGSVAMTSFLYLYFAGGILMVFLFYFVLGIFQNIIFNVLKPGKFLSTSFLFIIILPIISNIDSAVYGIISFFFREFIILLILQHIIFKKNLISFVSK
jgi:hypothetical protein